MYHIISVNNINESEWLQYYEMSQELNENYYPDRYREDNSLEVFRSGIQKSINKTKGYENYLIKYENLPVGWFYLTTWGDVLYIGIYFNTEKIDNNLIKMVLLFMYEKMVNDNFNELFTSSYRNTNIDFFKAINAEITEEFISSEIKRDDFNIPLFNSIADNYDLKDFELVYCNKIEETYADSYINCFNSAFSDLMNLNKVKLKYEPFTKEQLINNQNSDVEKHIILLLNNKRKVTAFSELYYDNKNRIYSCDSGFTAVGRELRGMGIAKFLKAKLYLQLLKNNPDFKSIKTNTLSCNKYINNINSELGFKEYRKGYSFRMTKQFLENFISKD